MSQPEPQQTPFLPVYRRAETIMIRGEGVYLFDDQGKRYLDCSAGIAVNALGHSHSHVVAALQEQAGQLWHCSNNYTTRPLQLFAERLVEQSRLDGGVFFCSSGAEAIDTVIKFVRRTQYVEGSKKQRIITFHGGFHGRALSCISAGGNATAREGYAPLLPGFDQIAFNDLEAVKATITPETAAILLEPVQGEGGVYPADPAFLKGLRELCDTHGLLLCLDEVQCGYGRCGSLFTYDQYGVMPDIVACAKGIGNGFPLGAVITNQRVRKAITPGCHGSTYGSNPLAMAVGNAVLDMMLKPGFFAHVSEVGAHLKAALDAIQQEYPDSISQVRGFGLMLGLQMQLDARAFATELREAGLLVAPAYGDVIRFTPPLIITREEADQAVSILRECLAKH